MEDFAVALKKYWSLSIYSKAIANLDINKVAEKHYIELDTLFKHFEPIGEEIDLLLAPYVAYKGDEVFCPFWLQVRVVENKIIPNIEQPLPIFPSAVLEPIGSNYVISSLREVEQIITLYPPEWKEPQNISLSEQIIYSKNILNKLCNNKWQIDLAEQGYTLLTTKVLIIEQIKVITALDKLKLASIRNWQFTTEQKGNFTTIEAANNCGKEAWIKNYILNVWTNAALNNTEPPLIAIVTDPENYTIPTIFSLCNTPKCIQTIIGKLIKFMPKKLQALLFKSSKSWLIVYWQGYAKDKINKFNKLDLSKSLWEQTPEQLIFTDANLLNSATGILLADQASGPHILFGNREIKYHTTVINQIERNNLVIAGIEPDSVLYENLEYNCLLSTDNYFLHMCNLAEDYEPMQQLKTTTNVAPGIIAVRNALAYYLKLDVINDTQVPAIKLNNIIAKNIPYLGSKLNNGEIEAIISWIQKEQPALEQCFAQPINKIIIIFTCFAAQKIVLKHKLHVLGLSVTVKTVAEYEADSFPLVLFSPVYSAEDTGPFVFDEGNEIFYKLLNACTEQFIIFGDQNLFNSQRHSASGIIANYCTLLK